MRISVQDTVLVIFLYICVRGTCSTLYSTNEPSVTTKGTTFIGKNGEVDFQGKTKTFKTFKGIPYAQPPVGKLRFKKPQRLQTVLPERYMATEYAAGCLQPSLQEEMKVFAPTKQSEDCLYLNVFVPNDKPDKGHEDTGHAVMVYIHGGAFVIGSGELGGEYLATFGNVIVVSLNYRLGVFGFLGSEDENAPGNIGLWDQQLAIQWVNENIASFGGDNKRVTIFGESSGAISATFQALYPPNKGLFQRVIAQSGSPGMKFLFLYSIKDSLKDYAEIVGCNKETPDEAINCLREKSADELSGTIQDLDTNEKSITDINVFPYLDNVFITIDPLKLADLTDTKGNEAIEFFRSLDIINGVNSHEGLGLYTSVFVPIIDNPETSKPTRTQMDTEAIPSVLAALYEPLDAPLVQLVSALYTDPTAPDCPDHLRDELVKLLGDLLMVLPAVEFSRLHVNSSVVTNSYVYFFTAIPSNPITPTFDWVKGANHGEDLGFVFFFRCLDERLPSNDWEYELSYDVMTYWSNFAKTGNPNKPEPTKVAWSKYAIQEQSYLLLDKDMSDAYRRQHFYTKEAEFWLETLPSARKALDKLKVEEPEPAQGSCSADGDLPCQ